MSTNVHFSFFHFSWFEWNPDQLTIYTTQFCVEKCHELTTLFTDRSNKSIPTRSVFFSFLWVVMCNFFLFAFNPSNMMKQLFTCSCYQAALYQMWDRNLFMSSKYSLHVSMMQSVLRISILSKPFLLCVTLVFTYFYGHWFANCKYILALLMPIWSHDLLVLDGLSLKHSSGWWGFFSFLVKSLCY